MADRDKDLTHLFVRDLDEIPLPPRGDWRRATRKEHIAMRASRSLLTAGVAVAVLALALIVGLQLRDRMPTAATPSGTPPPAPSSAPGVVAPTPSPISASATPTGSSTGPVLDDRYGFVALSSSGPPSIVSETGKTVGTLVGVRAVISPTAVVSPTGDRIAYVAVDGQGEVVRIRTVASGAESAGPSFGPTDRVGGLAWSSDGTGLLIGSGLGSDTGPAPTTPARLQAFDLSGGAPTVLATRQDGRVYAPIAWDRAAKVAAAAETGAGGFASAYLTFDLSQSPPSAKSVPIPGRVGIPVASTDGRYALLTDFDTRETWYWPIGYISSKKPVGTSVLGALWQPGTHRIGFITGDAFVLFQVDDGSMATAFRGIKVGTGSQPYMFLRLFRADGSAVVLAASNGAPGGMNDYTVIRLADGARASFQTANALVASVRLR